MKILFFLLVIIVAPFHPELFAQASFSAFVTKIIDGDSIIIKRGKTYIEVRLYGIDCPEWNQEYSTEARNYTMSLLYKQKIRVVPQYYDSYGRLVALLFKNGMDINGALVKSGFAWVYSRYCKKKLCSLWLTDQEIAKEIRLGLWKIEPPVPPWRWRKMYH